MYNKKRRELNTLIRQISDAELRSKFERWSDALIPLQIAIAVSKDLPIEHYDVVEDGLRKNAAYKLSESILKNATVEERIGAFENLYTYSIVILDNL